MTAGLECVETASALAAGGPAVERHLAGCDACRATARTLAVVRRAGAGGPADLWPRLLARVAEDVEPIRLRFPLPGWDAAAAVAAIVAATLLAPEPGRLLAVMLGVL